MHITYRPANDGDFEKIVAFVDRELARDAFVPRGQQKGYLQYKITLLAMCGQAILGWAVMSKNGTLIHLLVGKGYRGLGIGSEMLRLLNPKFVRSKKDQKAGDPTGFYNRHGFSAILTAQGRLENIDVLTKNEGTPPETTNTTIPTQQQDGRQRQAEEARKTANTYTGTMAIVRIQPANPL